MIPELGHIALIVALCVSFILGLLPLLGVARNNRVWMLSGQSLSVLMFLMTTCSFACLSYAFLTDDFSVRYVADNSNTLLPIQYKFSAVWSAHEGSLLLWVWLLTAWTAAVAWFGRFLPLQMHARVLAVLGLIASGFFLFTLLTSNPFARNFPFPPAEGADLNPLLQDFGLVIHPPVLYLGYVGFSVAFAFAISALLGGRLDASWARWARPWTMAAWMFLTLGIALGSWWAYYELGWGGWWFWDPVENASFMPWLTGTALIHSLAVTEKRGVFKSWTVLLAIFTFSLSLLGTFLVRSGVLTSVHAFATDPERGYFILAFLGLVVGGSLSLFAIKAPELKSIVRFDWVSREVSLLLNNLVLVVVMTIVLLGTLYPLIADALQLGKISVGPPYFNFFFIPLMFLLLLILPVGSRLRWKSTRQRYLANLFKKPLFIALILTPAVSFVATGLWLWQALLATFLFNWVVIHTVDDWFFQTRTASSFLARFRKPGLSYYSMFFGHLGIAVCALGIAYTALLSQEKDVRMEAGKHQTLGGYEFVFEKLEQVQGPNYFADRATVTIYQNGEPLAELKPEKRRYFSGRGQMMTEAGIRAGLFLDLYVAMGEPLDDSRQVWAMRLYLKPFVRCVWLGALIMALGACMSLLDKRYRFREVAEG
ncbi:MAG: heme lyase CcmF/NrfE family subunit [Pseudomonadales bacterium]|nr:heme lyase CcmF/NrfE family subunit [Pseudomonadales bacterium]